MKILHGTGWSRSDHVNIDLVMNIRIVFSLTKPSQPCWKIFSASKTCCWIKMKVKIIQSFSQLLHLLSLGLENHALEVDGQTKPQDRLYKYSQSLWNKTMIKLFTILKMSTLTCIQAVKHSAKLTFNHLTRGPNCFFLSVCNLLTSFFPEIEFDTIQFSLSFNSAFYLIWADLRHKQSLWLQICFLLLFV